MLVSLVVCMVLLGKIAKLQFVEGEILRNKADSLYVSMQPVNGSRGNILTEKGGLLATSLPYYNIHFDTKVVPLDTFNKYLDTLSMCLAMYVNNEYTIGAHRERLKIARKEGKRYYPIKNNVSHLEMNRIRNFPLFNKGGQFKSGLIVDKINKRQYPFKMLAHRTIGYIRPYVKTNQNGEKIKDSKGKYVIDTIKVGLEEAYDHVLAGESSMKPMKYIGKNIWVPLSDLNELEPKSGKDLVTTLDINIQDIAEEALLKSLTENEADHGCVLVMEVETGAIKAIANIGFNNERTDFWETKNYAIAEASEPGSTFKLATLMALLEHGNVSLEDSVILNKGKISFYDRTMEDASNHNYHKTTLSKAFEISSNVGIAALANKYYNKSKKSQQKYIDFIRSLRFEDSKLGFAGEGSSFIKDPQYADWSGITIPWMSIGYESYMTPLQILNLYNTVANNGKMMRPQIVKEIRAFGETEQIFEPEVIKRRLISKSTVEKLNQLLINVVEGEQGTAQNIKPNHYQIAGKTGTSIINYKDHTTKNQSKQYRASFVGYFPADQPKYSCIVVVTNPRKGIYGGKVAAPVFKEIADKCYSKILDVHQAINLEEKKYVAAKLPSLNVGHKKDLLKVMQTLKMPVSDFSDTDWAITIIKGDSIQLQERNMSEGKKLVPNVVGLGLRDAMYLLENAKINVKVTGIGKVLSQSVRPGRSVNDNPSIQLILG